MTIAEGYGPAIQLFDSIKLLFKIKGKGPRVHFRDQNRPLGGEGIVCCGIGQKRSAMVKKRAEVIAVVIIQQKSNIVPMPVLCDKIIDTGKAASLPNWLTQAEDYLAR